MNAFTAGQVLCGDDGRVHVRIWGERYYLYPEDLGILFFAGDPVPLLMKGPGRDVHEVAGTVSLNPSGRAVVIAIKKQRYMLSREKFLAVALGEEMACIFSEVPVEGPEIKEFSLHNRGAAP
ncbi:hypothetical protein [uncultured Methanoregula sp.]|uniref:hypothetical protein n=1 Tax=uncultured Methanoregula sp. TaxID=1005933 RepID=UPI002AAAFC70|nr:hypothetical protein [uncultured Methanoregula sp.]